MPRKKQTQIVIAAAVGLALLGLVYALFRPAVAAGPDKLSYNWDVRPILSDNCFRCHGPDAKQRKAGLRLDHPETAYAELPESPGKHAVVPGKPDSSELMRRVTSTDPEERMPPKETHKTLTEPQIAVLRKWIEQGAPYQPHWAYIPPVKPSVPKSAFHAQAVNDIDEFVFAKLSREKLTPSAQADKETLINRVSLTLTGLPPTLAEVDRFVADTGPDAYEKLVDRLLASPAYGERMASYWMDLARFAESDGYLDDLHDRLVWPWRDWVINAFNDNLPFDKFTTYQLAGDLLPERTRDEIIATAFLRLGKRSTENGSIPEEFRINYVTDRTDTIGTAFMGLTVGCARCHDHKYDPISQKDYYSLSGFFNSADEPGVYAPGYAAVQGGPTMPWPDAAAAIRMAETDRNLKEREAAYQQALRSAAPQISHEAEELAHQPAPRLQNALQQSLDRSLVAYIPFESTTPIPDRDLNGLSKMRLPPPMELVSLNLFSSFAESFSAEPSDDKSKAKPGRLRSFNPPPMAPQNYTRQWLSYSPNEVNSGAPAVLEAADLKDGVRGKAFFFSDTNKGFIGKGTGWYDRTDEFSIDLWFYAAERYDHTVSIINHRDEDTNAGGTGYRLELEDDSKLHLYLAHSAPYNMLALVSKDSMPLRKWTHLAFTYDGSSRASGLKLYIDGKEAAVEVVRDHLTRTMLPMSYGAVYDSFLGLAFGSRFREKSPSGSGLDEVRVFNRALSPIEVQFLHDPKAATNTAKEEELAQRLALLLTPQSSGIARSRAELNKARMEQNAVISKVPELLVFADAPQIRPPHRLERGLYSQPKEVVPIQALTQIFPWKESLPRDRRGLAQWLLDPKNPLTARVFVNRIWQMHFGQGLVDTAEDFGAQSANPTHPELLDYLAVRFVESGWDIKALHKLIVMSATYRQSSNASDELIKRDPTNRLLARGTRQRMPAEMVRDNVLAASGLLVNKIGGPSAHPYQPEGVWSRMISMYKYPKPTAVPPEEHHRRSVYTFVKRNAPHPGMQNFDFTDHNVSIARRRVSNTPLQALQLLNDPQYLEAYRVLADRVLATAKGEDEQVVTVFRLARRARPSLEQIKVLREYYDSQIDHFSTERASAQKLLSIGVAPLDPKQDPVRLAALTNVTALVMNTPDAYSIR